MPETPLGIEIRREIARRGKPMPVAEYMAFCLSHPEHGYYRRTPALGAMGDFITAPEISQTFGELIGLWAGDLWRRMGSPKAVRLVEFGPGRGTLIADALRALRVLPDFLAAVEVELVEICSPLIAAQRNALAGTDLPVRWSEQLAAFDGATIIIANEFLDTIPIHQAVRAAEGWAPRAVDIAPDGSGVPFEFVVAEDNGSSPPVDGGSSNVAAGQVGEWRDYDKRTSAPPLLPALIDAAGRGPLAALFIDYGYDGPPPIGDTLQAVRAHSYVDPLAAPGLADLTAHVDFADFRRQLSAAGLAGSATLTQHDFLAALGIEARAHRLISAASNAASANRIETGIHRLVAPEAMGTRFRAMVVHNGRLPPAPFAAYRESQ